MYATDWKEEVAPDEDARFAAMAETLRALQADRDARYGEKGRALHRKAHTGVEARFTVRDDLATVLPEPLHVGPFRPGATHTAYVRFSDATWERPKKDVPDIRGLAFKLVGVEGQNAMTGAEGPTTQDFLLNQTPRLVTRTPEEFLALVVAGSSGGQLGMLPRLAGAIGWGRALTIVWALVTGLGGFRSYGKSTFWSMVPFALGPAAARWSLVPVAPAEALAGPDPGTDLLARLRGGLAWDFRVQLYRDAARTPIEDPAVEWDAPWIVVGRLEIPPTDPDAARSRAVSAYVERLAFDPWHAVEALRPLGAINRARKATYYAGSSKHRAAAAEPDGSERFEDVA